MKRIIIIIGLLLGVQQIILAQTPQELVLTFTSALERYVNSKGSDVKQIDIMKDCLQGCRMNDDIAVYLKEFYPDILSSEGTILQESYWLKLARMSANSVIDNINITDVKLQCDFEEPMMDNKKLPAQFVTAKITVKGKRNFQTESMFYVRGTKITKIESYLGNNSLSVALKLYKHHEYKKAFSIFRAMALTDPTRNDAQYYTTVMILKKQGCQSVNKKLREMEATWYMTHRCQSTDDYSSMLSDLEDRFRPDDSAVSWLEFPLYGCGLMASKNKYDKFGYVDTNNVLKIPYVYDNVHSFSLCGVALVGKGGKYGYIDKSGLEITDLMYNYACEYIVDGYTFVMEDNKVYLIDLNLRGKKVKQIDGAKCKDVIYDGIKYVLVMLDEDGVEHRYDFNGNALE